MKQTHFQALAAFFGQTKHVATNILDDGTKQYSFEDRVAGGTRKIDPSVPFMPELLPHERHAARTARGVGDRPAQQVFSRATVNRIWAMMTGQPLLKRLELADAGRDER